jgi:hypothetical protein
VLVVVVMKLLLQTSKLDAAQQSPAGTASISMLGGAVTVSKTC